MVGRGGEIEDAVKTTEKEERGKGRRGGRETRPFSSGSEKEIARESALTWCRQKQR